MNEGRTTAIFTVVAAIALGLAWWSKPENVRSQSDLIEKRVNEDVFPSFQDTDSASSLQIVKYDEELAQLKRFEVARDSATKLWNLPSNDNYPADAAEQVRDATTPLIGLRILSVESDLRSDHELYGVVNPDDEELAAGTSGVGMLVTLKDEGNQVLASLIVGKEVEQVEGQRYVRIPTEDAVYKVELSTAPFTTEFRDWIEGELLQVRSFDITRVGIRDYELVQQSFSTMALQRNFDADLEYDTSSSKWTLASMTSYESGSAAPASLAADEEVNADFLNGLRTAVQDLEIVDVKKKPTGLAADLKADETLLQNQESIASLQTQGFYPAGGADGTEIFAAGGETIIGTQEGVDYLLRFGEATASLSADTEADSGISRYLLVTARLNDAQFPAPDLEPLPETVEEMLARERAARGEAAPIEIEVPQASENDADKAEASGEETPAVDGDKANEADGAAAEESSTAIDNKETSEGSEASADGSDTTEGSSSEANAGGKESDEGKEPAADPEPVQEETAAEASAPQETETATSDGGDADASGQNEDAQAEVSQEPEETAEELQERLEALREQIARDNQRKIDDRNERIDAARKRVQELNARFSEWYYVVSDTVYKKLTASRDELIKKQGAAAAPGAFQGLPGGGLPGGAPQFPQLNPGSLPNGN